MFPSRDKLGRYGLSGRSVSEAWCPAIHSAGAISS